MNNSAAVFDGKVYFGTSIPGLLHAVDAVFASIAISNGLLYFGALDGKLTAVDLKTQKAVCVFQGDTSKQNLPAIENADGTLNFGAIISQNFYDDMAIAVSELLSVGSILFAGGQGCDLRGKHGRPSVCFGLELRLRFCKC